MRIVVFLTVIMLSSFNCFCQTSLLKSEQNVSIDSVYNFFTEEYDTIVDYIGRIQIMPINFIHHRYIVKIDTIIGNYCVFHQGKILFKYDFMKGKINGTGYCYYFPSGLVGIQAQFVDNKMHGLVIVQQEDGTVIEIMRYKRGKYLRHLYDFQINSRKGLKALSKNRSANPLKNDEVITH